MCDCQPTEPPAPPTRRAFLAGAGAVLGAATVAGGLAGALLPGGDSVDAAIPPVQVMPGLQIFPRDAWGADLPPKGRIRNETPKFFLVHHTASSNSYTSARNLIRSTYAWHTSNDPSKRWPDVAYEFFVGRAGDVWEGRKGAMAGPVRADATGGSQGFAQLVCLLGDYSKVLPTAAQMASLVKVLAWLGIRYGIPTAATSRATFVSRGSQRFPAGTTVTTPTIAPHRAMSQTSCPGDAMIAAIPGLFAKVQAQRTAWKGVTQTAVRLGPVGN